MVARTGHSGSPDTGRDKPVPYAVVLRARTAWLGRRRSRRTANGEGSPFGRGRPGFGALRANTVAEPHTLPQGQGLGAYEVRQVLATGTFGNVYLCDEAESGGTVAVREYVPRGLAVRGDGMRVRPQSAVTEARFAAGLARFVERAELMMAVEHPNVVRIRNVFQANGTACVAMDYVAGTPLSALLDTGETLPGDKLRAYLRPVAEGLQSMHRAGIHHGNLGLGSILIGEDGSPVLLGLAVPGRDEFGNVGAPGYAPIEHYSARAGLGSARADVYSLAGILYRCVTGVAPPEAPTRAERDTLVPALRAAQGRGYSQRLLAAIDAGLTLDPEGRPEGVGALLDVLDDSAPPSDVEPVVAGKDAGARTSARGAMAARRAGPRSGRYKGGCRLGGRAADCRLRRDLRAAGRGTMGAGRNRPPPPRRNRVQTRRWPKPRRRSRNRPTRRLRCPRRPRKRHRRRWPRSRWSPSRWWRRCSSTTSPVGETPLELDGLVPGDYRIVLRHPHYDDVASELALPEGSTTFERELVRATGALRVVTTPAGAWVESRRVAVGRRHPRDARGAARRAGDAEAGRVRLRLGRCRRRGAEGRHRCVGARLGARFRDADAGPRAAGCRGGSARCGGSLPPGRASARRPATDRRRAPGLPDRHADPAGGRGHRARGCVGAGVAFRSPWSPIRRVRP